MKAFLALLCIVAAASAGYIPATTLVRTPSLDSAVIKSERLGGNFAYSSVEGHSYAAVSPVVQHVATPVAVSYKAHAPVVTGYTAHVGAPTLYASHYAAPYSYGYGAYAPFHSSVVVA
ncbi:pupal cuticle protein G1A-like [Ischnura elegans]|uniref:pupal cuticle protein G1A-like n=1 Tax=Ischnura elegans TaxID=197161 RepID=UPI001ED87B51|nr:pupal cuticle protein G1A-like [Ischnura elegans]